MKLSILTTITDPEKRQDAYLQAIQSYLELADEVIIVDGTGEGYPIDTPHGRKIMKLKGADKKVWFINLPWPEDWNYIELPKHLNAGLDKCTGDWVIKLDIDQMFHENDIPHIKTALTNLNHCPVATFQKFSVYPNKKYLEKFEQILAINRNYAGEVIGFGKALSKKTDLCEPIYITGYEKIDGYDLPIGAAIPIQEIGRTGITFWNFDFTFKDQETTKKLFHSFAKAYNKMFDTTKLGTTPEKSFEVFVKLMHGRQESAVYTLTKPEILPKWIADKYWNCLPNRFGYNGWGLI